MLGVERVTAYEHGVPGTVPLETADSHLCRPSAAPFVGPFCMSDKVATGDDAYLAEQEPSEGLDGVHGEVQLLADGAVALASAHAAEDPQLAFGERRSGQVRRRGRLASGFLSGGPVGSRHSVRYSPARWVSATSGRRWLQQQDP